jgi:hypothetical protein
MEETLLEVGWMVEDRHREIRGVVDDPLLGGGRGCVILS